MDATLIVGDAAPLLALALAGRLDALLAPSWPVTIPDAVYRSAIVHPDLGEGIFEWVRDNEDRVRMAMTEAGLEHDILLRAGFKKPSGTARNSAAEATRRFLDGAPDRRVALLIADDTWVSAPVRAEPMTVGRFLAALEQGWEAGLADIARENEQAWSEKKARGLATLREHLARNTRAHALNAEL